MAGPVMINWELIEQTGFLKLIKAYNKSKPNDKFDLKDQMRQILRVVDEQDAISRFEWGNIPQNLKVISDEIERLVYFKGSLCLFWFNNKYYVLPFAGSDIDVLGRFNTVTPVPIASDSDNYEEQKSIFGKLNLHVFYTVPTDEEIAEVGGKEKVAVIIRDYPNQINAQYITPRWIMNEPLLDIEAEIFPMARTARMLATGVKGMLVNNEDDAQNVEDANETLEEACLTGKPYIPVTAQPSTKDVQNGSAAKNEEFMQSLQTLENWRLGSYGIANGGLFQKKAHTLEGEQEMNGGPINGRLECGLNIRKNSCDIFNKVFGENLTVKIKENASPSAFMEIEENKEKEENYGDNNTSD